MTDDNSTGKGTSGMDKFSSKVHRVHMELKGMLLNSLKIETQFLERLQSVSVVDGAAHTQRDDVDINSYVRSSTCTTRGSGTSNMVWFITLLLRSLLLDEL